MVLEGAEPAGEADLLLRGELLLPEEQDQMLVQETLDGAHGLLVIRRQRQVDPEDLGADGGGQGPYDDLGSDVGHEACQTTHPHPRRGVATADRAAWRACPAPTTRPVTP